MLSYLILYYLSCQDPVMVRLAKTHPNTRMPSLIRTLQSNLYATLSWDCIGGSKPN